MNSRTVSMAFSVMFIVIYVLTTTLKKVETTRALCYGIGNHHHKLVSSIETFR